MNHLLFALIVGILLPACSTQQMMKHTSKGTSQEDVLKNFGPPTSRESVSGYDVWLYVDSRYRECKFLFSGETLAFKPQCGDTDRTPARNGNAWRAIGNSMGGEGGQSFGDHLQRQTPQAAQPSLNGRCAESAPMAYPGCRQVCINGQWSSVCGH